MTQPARTTETINRDNAAIRDVMHRIRELTVPDRATLAVGLIGHLATMMNRAQMSKLMQELADEAERVQDVPPSRQGDREDMEAAAGPDARATDERDGRQAGSNAAGGAHHHDSRDARARGDVLAAHVTDETDERAQSLSRTDRGGRTARGDGGDNGGRDDRVGQAGRGAFRSETLL